MGCNCNKLSNMCGDKMKAPCIEVEKDFPSCSSLKEVECTSLDEVIDDLYDIICTDKEDLSDFATNCLDYGEEELTAKKIKQVHNVEICTLKDEIETLGDICNTLNLDINECNIDYSCLIGTDDCGETTVINNLSNLLQVMIDKICALENQ